MSAYRADLRRLLADDDCTAVAALPLLGLVISNEGLCSQKVGKDLAISLLVALLNTGDEQRA